MEILTGKTLMQTIRDGLKEKHRPRDDRSPFAEAVYGLFREYATAYRTEWERIDDNERIYQGDHWRGEDDRFLGGDERIPRPSTPIVTSTIENIKADLSDEFPEAMIVPEVPDNEIAAKVLTQVVRQELSACGFAREYDKHTQDVLNDGWSVWEVGFDPDMNQGNGGTFLRYVINKNWMCDPKTLDMQQGRAVFKFDRLPIDWFWQHYPEYVPFMKGDDDLVNSDHDDFNATTRVSNEGKEFRLIEAWFRVFDPKTRKYKVHMVLLAGGQVLENSYEEKPEGYYRHGMYPFVISRLYPQKGSALGIGITDLFKGAQRYSDKLDQILMLNTFRASRPRLLIQKGMVDYDDARDFGKEVIETDGAPAASMQWQQANPLPSHIMSYIMSIRETIKAESGSNEQSRGNTASGVTAASAIAALQDMSTKRSRMEARALHYGFEDAISMLLEVLREFSVVERKITVTIDGKRIVLPFSKTTMNDVIEGGKEIPMTFHVSIKTSRQTKYTKQAHNDLWLQMMQTIQNADPVVMLEGLDYDDKEQLLDNIQRAQRSGMLALQNQLAELSEAFQQAQEELAQYKKTNAEMSNLIRQSNDRIQGLTEQQGAPQQGGAPQQPMMGGMQMDQSDMNRMTGLMG